MKDLKNIKLALLLDVCEFYWCDVKINYSNGEGNFEFDNGEEHWENHNLDWALFSWYDTMVDTDNEQLEEGYNPMWADEIAFIERNVIPNCRKN